MICSFDQTRLAKVSFFSEYTTNLSPSVCTCMTIKYGSKLVHFIRMRVPIYLIFNISHLKSYLKNNHEYFKESEQEKKAFQINISYLICRTSTIYLYVKEKKIHMCSECFILAHLS